MPALTYNADVAYDTPDYTYDGEYVGGRPDIKTAVYRELVSGSVLSGLVPAANVKLDLRSAIPSARDGGPWLIFRRVTARESNDVPYASERFEFEVIARDDATLEAVRAALLDEFAGTVRHWGAFDAEGNAVIGGGLKLKGIHLTTVEDFDSGTGEGAIILAFRFSYVREV